MGESKRFKKLSKLLMLWMLLLTTAIPNGVFAQELGQKTDIESRFQNGESFIVERNETDNDIRLSFEIPEYVDVKNSDYYTENIKGVELIGRDVYNTDGEEVGQLTYLEENSTLRFDFKEGARGKGSVTLLKELPAGEEDKPLFIREAESYSIRMKLKTQFGDSVGNANIILTNETTGQVFERQADGSGGIFAQLPAGDYSVSTNEPGFSTQAKFTVSPTQREEKLIEMNVDATRVNISFVDQEGNPVEIEDSWDHQLTINTQEIDSIVEDHISLRYGDTVVLRPRDSVWFSGLSDILVVGEGTINTNFSIDYRSDYQVLNMDQEIEISGDELNIVYRVRHIDDAPLAKVKVVDQFGFPVAGATVYFRDYKHYNNYTYITDEDGMASMELIDEVQEGYKTMLSTLGDDFIDDEDNMEPREMEIDGEGLYYEFEVYRKVSTLTIEKVDEEGNALEGAEFEIDLEVIERDDIDYEWDDEEPPEEDDEDDYYFFRAFNAAENPKGLVYANKSQTYQATTDKDGKLVIVLPEQSEFTIKEVAAPEGYEMESIDYSYEMDNRDEVRESLKVINKKIEEPAKLNVRVEDQFGEPLSWADLEITGPNGLMKVETDRDGSFSADELALGDYTVEFEANGAYVNKKYTEKVTLESGDEKDVLIIVERKLNELTIIKVDEDGNRLDGAEFEVEYVGSFHSGETMPEENDDEEVMPEDFSLLRGFLSRNNENIEIIQEEGQVVKLTLDNGSAKVKTSKLDGKLIIRETKTPEGYKALEEDIVLDLDVFEDNVYKLEVVNEKVKYKVDVLVKDEAGAEVDVSRFRILDSQGRVIAENEAQVELAAGRYTVEHYEVQDGYEIVTKKVNFEIKDQDQEVVLEVKEIKPGRLILRAKDQYGRPISGVDYRNINEELDIREEYYTNGNGEIVIEDLKPGDYRMELIYNLGGYKNDKFTEDYTISAGKTSELEWIFTKEIYELEINKVDEEGNPLKGASFELYREEDYDGDEEPPTEDFSLITRDYQEVDFETISQGQSIKVDMSEESSKTIKLEYGGTYKIREIVAPEGYEIDETEYEVLVNDEKNEITIVNKKIPEPAKVTVNVVDNYGRPIKDAGIIKFGPINATTSVYTNEEGSMEYTNLPAGDYVIALNDIPSGYTTNEERNKPVTLEEGDHKIIEWVIEKELVELEIIKTDEEGNLLDGAEFEIVLVPNDNDGELDIDEDIEEDEEDYYLFRASPEVDYIEIEENVPFILKAENGKASIKVDKGGVFEIREIKAPEGYILDEEVYKSWTGPGSSDTITIVNEKAMGNLELHKVDDEDKALADVEFIFTNIKTQETFEAKTNTDGKINLELPVGDYQVKEVAAPKGYKVNDSIENVKVELNKTSEIKVVNERILYTLDIEVVDTDKNPVDGSEFEIYDAEGNLVSTDIKTKLAEGKYNVVHTKVKDGYIMIDYEIDVNLDKNLTVVFEVEKEVIPEPAKITVNVVDSYGNKIPGAGFTYQSNAGKSDLTHSDKEGSLSFDDLDAGGYTIKLDELPEGYVSDKTEERVSLKEGEHLVVDWVLNRAFAEIEILKVDEDGNLLDGAEFEIKAADGSGQTIKVKAEGGIASVEVDAAGVYLVKETLAPEGYALDEKEHQVQVELFEKRIIEIENKKALEQVKLTKVNDEGEVLEAVEFKFTNVKTNQVFEAKTNKDGLINLELPVGEYKVEEVLAPAGHKPAAAIPNIIVGLDEEVEIEVVNELIKHKLTIKVVDEEANPVDGSEFEVLDENGNKLEDYTKPLKPGKYTIKHTKVKEGYEMVETEEVIVLDEDSEVVFVVKKKVVEPVEPEDKPNEPEDKPNEPEDKPNEPEDKPNEPEDKPNVPEETPGGDNQEQPDTPEETPSQPEDKPNIPEETPNEPEDTPNQPEETPDEPEDKPTVPEETPEEVPVVPQEPEDEEDDEPIIDGPIIEDEEPVIEEPIIEDEVPTLDEPTLDEETPVIGEEAPVQNQPRPIEKVDTAATASYASYVTIIISALGIILKRKRED